MQKESSLITVSSAIKKFFLIVLIISILIICWNTIKNIPEMDNPITPAGNKYTYLNEKKLTADFEPAALESINGISLYSKTVLSQGRFPELTKYVYIYQVTRSAEDFSTVQKINNIAGKFNFSQTDQSFQNNLILYKKDNSNLIFDRSDLSIDYFLTNPSIESKPNENEQFENLNEYITSLGLELNKFDLANPVIFNTKNGKVNVFFRNIEYIAMNENNLTKYIQDTKLSKSAKIIDRGSYSGELTVEYKETEEFNSSNIIKLSHTPLQIIENLETAGVYKLLDLNQAFQEINTFKVEPNSDTEENVQSGSLFNLILFNKNSFFDQVDINQITKFDIDAEKTTLAYIVNHSEDLLYLHPIYIFTGEGKLSDNEEYTFFIYVDALPKN